MSTERQPSEDDLESVGMPLLPKELLLSFRMTAFVTVLILIFTAVVFSIPTRASTLFSVILAILLLWLAIGVARKLSIPVHRLLSTEVLYKLDKALQRDRGELHLHVAVLSFIAILLGLSLFASARTDSPASSSTRVQPSVSIQPTPTMILTPTAPPPTSTPTYVAARPLIPTETPTRLIMFLRRPTETPDAIATPTTTEMPLMQNLALIRPGVLIADVRYTPSVEQSDSAEEYILLLNFDEVLDMTGWTLSLDSGEIFRFKNHIIAPRSSTKIYTVGKRSMPAKLSWNLGVPLWRRSGYLIVLRDSSGLVIDQYEFKRNSATKTPGVPATS